MKRIDNLFECIISTDNLNLALLNAKKGKSHYTAVQEVCKYPNNYIQNLQDMLGNHKFTTSEYRIKKIFEPKERDIYILPFYPDRIVHHAIMQVLQPILNKMFIYDLYSAIPGRGIHMGYDRVKQFLKDHENTQYCLKFDIRKFYPSINNDILYQQVCDKIKCKETLWLLRDIIYSNGGEINLPIGNYLSQYLSNLYMNKFDHWLKEDMHIKYYARYCDDGVIFDKDKEFLKYLLKDIDKYLINNLKLNLNPKTRIVNVDAQGIDFLGYRMFRKYSLLRKSSVRTIKKKINMFEHHPELYSPLHIISSIMSIYGWAAHCNSHNLLTKYLFENKKINELMEDCSNKLKINNPLTKIIIRDQEQCEQPRPKGRGFLRPINDVDLVSQPNPDGETTGCGNCFTQTRVPRAPHLLEYMSDENKNVSVGQTEQFIPCLKARVFLRPSDKEDVEYKYIPKNTSLLEYTQKDVVTQ